MGKNEGEEREWEMKKKPEEPNLGNNLILLLLVFGRTGVCCLRAEDVGINNKKRLYFKENKKIYV